MWFINVYMDGVIKEMKVGTHGEGTELILNGKVWRVPTCLYADDAVLFVEVNKNCYLRRYVLGES